MGAGADAAAPRAAMQSTIASLQGNLPAAAGEQRLASLRRQARIQRVLIIAIFFVASLQFFLHGPSVQQRGAAIHPFHRGLKEWSRSSVRSAKSAGNAAARTSAYATSTASVNATANRTRNGGDNGGEFCQYCRYSDNAMCEDRLSFLMTKYHLSKAKALENDLVIERCIKPPGDHPTGEFCRYCHFNDNALCEDRVTFLKARYHLSEEQAKENDLVEARCKMPPAHHIVYAEADVPYLIFHGGPHKTGTTALQTFIYDLNWANKTLFLKDNLRVPTYDELPGLFGKEGVGLNLPHCSIRDYKDGGGQENIGQCSPMRQAFPKFLHDAYKKSQNVLIVAEDFDQLGIDFERMRFFLRPYNKIKFAVTYRRLHEWLPSFYQNIVDHWTKIYARNEAHFPSFVEWLDTNYDKFLQMHTMGVADRFRAFDIVESVDVLNLHAVPNLIEHYFCNHLRAENVCQAIKEGAKPSKTNAGAGHEYERLAIEANNRGQGPAKYNMHVEVQRMRAARYLKEEVEKVGVDNMPKVCPPKEMLDKMLAKEMEQERTHFPEWYESQGGDEGLRKAFDAAVKKKFCAFDVEEVFEQGTLDHVFEQWSKKS